MYTQVEKPNENKTRAAANFVSQKKSNGKQGFGFVDNRSDAIAQRKQLKTIQRLTISYTNSDLGHPPAVPSPFRDEVINMIVYQRYAIPIAVKHEVDGYGDCPAVGVYNHHVGHDSMLQKIKDLCEGKSRRDIVDALVIRMDLLEIGFGAQNPVDPFYCVAAFNSWLDNAIVQICDWPRNIFRGAKAGGEPDYPIAPSPALTARLNDARDILRDIDML